MAACGRLLVLALLVAVAFVPPAVTATRLLRRFGEPRSCSRVEAS